MTHKSVVPGIIGVAVLVVVSAADPLAAQQRPDSSARKDTLESVVIRATRAKSGGVAAAVHTTTRAELQKTNTGQDAPLALRATPSMISYSESGSGSGYSYVRLRGVDQTRLNITIDGVPLNDGED